MVSYNWHDDPTKSGKSVNVDDLNESLMYLKSQLDLLIVNKVNGAGLTLWVGTQEDYDALAPNYDPNTLYFINS